MSDQDPPDSGAGGAGGPSRRKRLEGVIPELLKRAIEIGVDRAQDAPESLKHFVGELKLPKEIASYILQQVDETKNGLFRVVAKEMRDFLEHANLSGEMQKILTTVQFEVNTTIRFRPNEGKSEGPESNEEASDTSGIPRPDVKTDLFVKRDDRSKERRRTRE
jgi:hypothetical protein